MTKGEVKQKNKKHNLAKVCPPISCKILMLAQNLKMCFWGLSCLKCMQNFIYVGAVISARQLLKEIRQWAPDKIECTSLVFLGCDRATALSNFQFFD